MTGAECARRRAELGWSAQDLALRAGLSLPTVLGFESGAKTPREGTLIALRKVFALRAERPNPEPSGPLPS